MKISNERGDIAVCLQGNGRIVVTTQKDRHVHAVRQLQSYLPGRNIEVIEITELNKAISASRPDTIDLLVMMTDSADEVPADMAASEEVAELKEDAFLLRTGRTKGIAALLAAGGGLAGVIHAVNELGLHHLITNGDVIELPAINKLQSPSLPYRLLWTWDHSTNWYLEQVGIQEVGALNYFSKPSGGFLEDYRRLVDFMSLNRISGVNIYGFLRDNHGGIEAAKELCRYAAERGVRILPGVGINAYGGIYWEGDHRYNLTTWLQKHPELRAVFNKPVAFHIPDMPELWFPESRYTDTACPSKPENASYHEEAIQWLAETFQIGGINFETGDYGTCNCSECSARRTEDETWSLKDMALLYPRLFEAARRGRSDLWLVSEAYWDNILNLDLLAPLEELPEDAIYQFCINRSYWQKVKKSLTREHVSHLPRPRNVLRTHMGTQWNNERYELVARRFADMMQLVYSTGMQGATIFGEVSSFSVVNEINYLAFARFGYEADLTWGKFVAKDLGPMLGGTETAEHYLKLLAVSNNRQMLASATEEAREEANAQKGESFRRWIWLQNRLYQKMKMLPD